MPATRFRSEEAVPSTSSTIATRSAGRNEKDERSVENPTGVRIASAIASSRRSAGVRRGGAAARFGPPRKSLSREQLAISLPMRAPWRVSLTIGLLRNST